MPRVLTLDIEDYLWFVDDCLDAMVRIVGDLGDDLASTAPELPGANSPYAILTHCLGVVRWWGGEMVADHDVERDRDAEFVATGAVADLVEEVRRTRAVLRDDLTALRAGAPTARPSAPDYAETPFGRSQAGVLMHIFHELAQHLGQMEITRDVLRARR
jgi:hypothetical protein